MHDVPRDKKKPILIFCGIFYIIVASPYIPHLREALVVDVDCMRDADEFHLCKMHLCFYSFYLLCHSITIVPIVVLVNMSFIVCSFWSVLYDFLCIELSMVCHTTYL